MEKIAELERVGIYINTEDECKAVMQKMFSMGLRWNGRTEYVADPWKTYKNNVCLATCGEEIMYASKGYYNDSGYKLIEASEFLGKPVEVAKSKEVLPEIKPCYCGKIPALAPETVCGKAAWAIKCECGRMSAYILKELCIEAWNRFVLVPPLKTDTEHCQHCGAYIGVEVHSAKCPNRMIPYTGPSVFEIKKHKESRIFYDDLASHGRPIPKRILGANAKRLKSSEEVGEE